MFVQYSVASSQLSAWQPCHHVSTAVDAMRLGTEVTSRLLTGVHYDSSTEKYQIGVTARKNIQLGSSETWLKLSQDALYDPKTQKVLPLIASVAVRLVYKLQTPLHCRQVYEICVTWAKHVQKAYATAFHQIQSVTTAPTAQQTTASCTNPSLHLYHLIVDKDTQNNCFGETRLVLHVPSSS